MKSPREHKQTFIDVNNNDFATVYLREACAKLSLPKREEREETHTDNAEAKNTAAICERVSANAAVSPRCLCVPPFGSLVVGRKLFLLCLVQRSDLFRKRKCACLGGAERRRLYQDRHT